METVNQSHTVIKVTRANISSSHTINVVSHRFNIFWEYFSKYTKNSTQWGHPTSSRCNWRASLHKGGWEVLYIFIYFIYNDKCKLIWILNNEDPTILRYLCQYLLSPSLSAIFCIFWKILPENIKSVTYNVDCVFRECMLPTFIFVYVSSNTDCELMLFCFIYLVIL
jgi:hypothetical protein